MKTLKTFFVLLAVIVASSSYGQTKEETIEWLNRNGKDFFDCNCSYIVNKTEEVTDWNNIELISNDTLRIINKYTHKSKLNNSFYDVPYTSILYQDINTVSIIDYKDCPQIKSFVVKNVGFIKGYNNQPRESAEGDLYIRFDKTNEENAKRTLKAIMHLAKLSGAKENKQTF